MKQNTIRNYPDVTWDEADYCDCFCSSLIIVIHGGQRQKEKKPQKHSLLAVTESVWQINIWKTVLKTYLSFHESIYYSEYILVTDYSYLSFQVSVPSFHSLWASFNKKYIKQNNGISDIYLHRSCQGVITIEITLSMKSSFPCTFIFIAMDTFILISINTQNW